MKNKSILLFLLVTVLFMSCHNNDNSEKFEYALVLHGGAGYMSPETLPIELQEEYKKAMSAALEKGLSLLENNHSSADAVEQVIRIMEDSPLFNAGKGAVFTHQGTNELDASIMNGQNLNAGAVAGVTSIKNPISAARKVMTESEHVLLSGKGADDFAAKQDLEIVNPEYFYTEERFNSLINELQKQGINVDSIKLKKLGTVGCVALDKNGNLCAGTSTGGRTNKKFGRIGDSPLIGAGTYANNATCGVSATGHGEYFIRYVACHEISALVKYNDMTVGEAAFEVVQNQLKSAGGDGGVICLDAKGNYAMEFNTSGMFRAYGNSAGKRIIKIFPEE